MTMLESGWVIVGSTPSTDGTTRTKGDGCLLVLDSNGQLVTIWAGPNINGPWGNMAMIDNGTTATLFVSMAGFDVPGPEVRDARDRLPGDGQQGNGAANRAVDSRGEAALDYERDRGRQRLRPARRQGCLPDRPDRARLAPDGTLYVSDALGNRIVAIEDATTRTTSAGTGRTVTKDGLLKRPLALAMTPNGNLLVTNARTARSSRSTRAAASSSTPNGSTPTRRSRRPATATCSASR